MDTEYVWEKATSIINVMKNLLSSNPKNNITKCMITWVDWAKKYLHMFALSIQLVVIKDFSHEPFHDQQPGYFNS